MLNFQTTTHNANAIEQTALTDEHTATVAIYPVESKYGQTGAYDIVVKVDGDTVKEWRAPKGATVPSMQHAGQAVAARAIG